MYLLAKGATHVLDEILNEAVVSFSSGLVDVIVTQEILEDLDVLAALLEDGHGNIQLKVAHRRATRGDRALHSLRTLEELSAAI